MTTYTPEQADVLEWMTEEDGITLVHAGAGCGKTFLAKEIIKLLEPNTCLYTAFNKAIVKEGIPRFRGYNVECKTLHALAWAFVKPTREINDLSYTCIEENLPYKAKRRILDAINDFYVSASVNMYEYMDEVFDLKSDKKLAEIAVKYITLMVEGKIDPTFNFLLKYFHLCLDQGTANCNYDLVILDEINDTTAVSLEIFKLIKAPKKLGLGETYQAIYDFLNLVDGFELMEGQATVMPLTQSFRCSSSIASKIQHFMREEVSEDFTFVGTDEPILNHQTLYCTATNAMIIKEIHERLASNQGFHLLRDLKEIFAYPMAIITAGRGKTPYQRKFKYLEDEFREFEKLDKRGLTWFQYLNEYVDDDETKNAVRLLTHLQRKGINLFQLYKDAQNADDDFDYTIATVYTSKGLEFETVYIADDLNQRIKKIREEGGIKNHDDVVAYRCYYVAASRCGKYLNNAVVL
jgi:superfamily I DNA/RNA helicase